MGLIFTSFEFTGCYLGCNMAAATISSVGRSTMKETMLEYEHSIVLAGKKRFLHLASKYHVETNNCKERK